jgi:hypothetical protein
MYSVAYVIVSPSLPSTSIGMPLQIPATQREDRKGTMVVILTVLAGRGWVFCYSNGDFLAGKPVERLEAQESLVKEERRFNARRTCVNGSEVQEKLGKGGLIQERPA